MLSDVLAIVPTPVALPTGSPDLTTDADERLVGLGDIPDYLKERWSLDIEKMDDRNGVYFLIELIRFLNQKYQTRKITTKALRAILEILIKVLKNDPLMDGNVGKPEEDSSVDKTRFAFGYRFGFIGDFSKEIIDKLNACLNRPREMVRLRGVEARLLSESSKLSLLKAYLQLPYFFSIKIDPIFIEAYQGVTTALDDLARLSQTDTTLLKNINFIQAYLSSAYDSRIVLSKDLPCLFREVMPQQFEKIHINYLTSLSLLCNVSLVLCGAKTTQFSIAFENLTHLGIEKNAFFIEFAQRCDLLKPVQETTAVDVDAVTDFYFLKLYNAPATYENFLHLVDQIKNGNDITLDEPLPVVAAGVVEGTATPFATSATTVVPGDEPLSTAIPSRLSTIPEGSSERVNNPVDRTPVEGAGTGLDQNK